ncbi:conjugal transfer protein TraF [Halorubrum sp. GN11GM_10-3_MGM]|uniref:conjugal transfer protein TraF n=1 Tax=Halorubrum sp. GN11GM_10-3_MGM TaxID=2518111 RepID=UPI0013052ED6|nr:conjugal transfer protein TraF [Halorubrum sp. GN11GM_10-3_MGM]
MKDESNADEDIRKQSILDQDDARALTATGVNQADRLMDRLTEIETLIAEHDHTAEANSDRLDGLSDRLDQLEENQEDLESDIEQLRTNIDGEFDDIDGQLEDISEAAGIQFPARIRTKVTVPVAVTFLAFTLFSGGIALFNGDSIPIRTQLSSAVTIGLLSVEVIEYVR